ncbi:MAG: BTAD domain-containing putative transcriptional regulator [Vulcanimicrobiaceae bacterium]
MSVLSEPYPQMSAATVPTLNVRCLGQFRLLGGNGWQQGPPLKKGREFLAYLVTHPRCVASKEKLIDAFWPGVDGDEGTHRVHLAASGARCTLRTLIPGIDAVQSVPGGYMWNPNVRIASDLDSFLSHADNATIASFESGVTVYAGDFLAGDRGEWIEPLRIWYASRYLEMLVRLAEDAAERREFMKAVNYGLRIMESDPGHEAGARCVMFSFASMSRRSAALMHYEGLKSYLVRHMGVAPSAETTALWQRIRDGKLPP